MTKPHNKKSAASASFKKALIILLDAFRPDYISRDITPFLYNLKANHIFFRMKTQVGYSPGAHATIWSGLHQDKHGKFLIFHYNPKTSPFKWAKWLGIIPSPLRAFIIAALKIPYYKIRALNRNPPKWYKKIIEYPPALPPRIAPFISTGVKPNHKNTLFTILEQHKISWYSQTDYGAAYLTKSKPKPLSEFKITDADIDFFYFYYADGLGHVKGVHSKELRAYLKEVDKTIKRLFDEAHNKFGDFRFFIFSDHGMCELKYFVNIQKHLKKLPLKQPEDYIAFYDATMARFWVFNEKARKLLITSLKRIPHTTLIDNRLRKKYHLEFKDNKWGDIFLLMHPHYRPFPDYFAPLRGAIKAYHGYDPDYPCSYGIFLSNNVSKKGVKEIKIVDIFPTILKALKLPIPKHIDGKPVF